MFIIRLFLSLHLDGLDIGEHVQPEEGHDPDEADSQPGRDKHEVHELDGKPEDAVEKEGGEAFLLQLKPALVALFPLQPRHAHIEDDHQAGGEDQRPGVPEAA